MSCNELHTLHAFSCNELHGLYVHVQATMMSTNQVGCKIVTVWVARDVYYGNLNQLCPRAAPLGLSWFTAINS